MTTLTANVQYSDPHPRITQAGRELEDRAIIAEMLRRFQIPNTKK